MRRIIDPPSGWRYGFPKVFDNPNDLDTDEWFIQNGYPIEEVQYWHEHGKSVPYRIWTASDDE